MSRAPRSRLWATVTPIDALAVYYWCETSVVHVTPAEIKAGRTSSCGRRGCHEPEAA